MESIVRNVRDIPTSERSALEHLIGQPLREDQQVIFSIVNVDAAAPAGEKCENGASAALPAWCNVYEGLSDEEIAEIEKSIVRTSSSRSFE